MTRKLYWGIATLIVLLIGVSVFMLMHNTDTEPEKVYRDVEPSKEVMDSLRQGEMKPTEEPDGHFHADGSFHDGTDAEHANVSEEVIYPHQALLDTNPALALKAQAEDRGHWSARWIPPFAADDTQAQAFARNEYFIHYYESINDLNNPIYIQAMREEREQRRAIMEYPYGPRKYDLMLITRCSLNESDVYPLYVGGVRLTPSDYFPLYYSDLK